MQRTHRPFASGASAKITSAGSSRLGRARALARVASRAVSNNHIGCRQGSQAGFFSVLVSEKVVLRLMSANPSQRLLRRNLMASTLAHLAVREFWLFVACSRCRNIREVQLAPLVEDHSVGCSRLAAITVQMRCSAPRCGARPLSVTAVNSHGGRHMALVGPGAIGGVGARNNSTADS